MCATYSLLGTRAYIYAVQWCRSKLCTTTLKKNQTTPRPSEHPPVMGETCCRWWYHFYCVANKERRPRKDTRHAGPPAKRICLPRSVDDLARLPNKHNNRPRCLDRPRCLRVVNSGIHAPHPLDLRGVIIEAPKPPILLNFEHLKHRGPCRQRPLSSLE